MITRYAVFFLCLSVYATDVIQQFTSDITVDRTGTLHVTETIVLSHGHITQIKGIFREFPTIYTYPWGGRFIAGFDIKRITRNNAHVPYIIEKRKNGSALFMRDPDKFLTPGIYTFVIEYTTTRQLGFFSNHDELYWNVTGNNWRLPILAAQATIHLPSGVPLNKVNLEAYTGYSGEKKHNYTIDKNTLTITTTQPLAPQQGLTIALSWPPGFVHHPTAFEYIKWFLKDNLSLLYLLVVLILLLGIYIRRYRQVLKQRAHYTIIPRYYPPEDMSPGVIRALVKMDADTLAVSSEFVQLAVKGFIDITYTKAFFGSGSYTFTKKEYAGEHNNPNDPLLNKIYKLLFSSKKSISTQSRLDKITLTRISSEVMLICNSAISKYLSNSSDMIAIGIGISAVSVYPLMLFPYPIGTLEALFIGLIILANILFIYLLRSYTPEGDKLKAEIDGFKLFLATTETERLKIIGTPPTRTPELFETYLPYAIALGVEEAWTRQFAPIFKNLEQQGHPYSPMWWHGPYFFANISRAGLGSSLSNELSSFISSSGTVPGSGSGMGGGGSSGGGGGGGGGGTC